MKIVLKHILKNIWEKKGRSLLIILSLIIATTVFTLNLTIPDELVLKVEDTLRSIYGDAEIDLKTGEPFSFDDVKKTDEKITYIPYIMADVFLDDKPAAVVGIDIENAKKMKLLGESVPNLAQNELIIGKKIAEKHSYKKGQIIKANIDEKEYEFEIVQVAEPKGIPSLNTDYPMFICNLETIADIQNIEAGKYDGVYIDVENDDNIKDYVEYLKENNKDFIVSRLVDAEAIKEQTSVVSAVMVLIFVLATTMIFFVVSSLNKIVIEERIPVIGTFRSVGASKGKMNFILVLENAVYGLIGGIIGSIMGYLINSKVATLFIGADDVDITTNTSKMSLSVILIGIIFAVILEIFISIKAIRKANKKPIKDIIFNVQNSRYRITKPRIIIGSIMFVSALVINYLNSKMIMGLTIASIILLMGGISNLVPLIMRAFSVIFASISKKIGWATGVIAGRNIGYNKMIISSARLIVISISLMLSIITMSGSVSNLFESYKYIVDDYNIVIENASKEAEEYDKLINVKGVKEVNYMFATWDENTKCNGKKISATFLGQEEPRKYIKEIDYKIKDLKDDEMLIDEKLAEKNNIKLNDKLNFEFGTLNKEISFRVVGFVNSAYFTTSRNAIVIDLETFREKLTNVPLQIHIATDDGVNLEKVKKSLKNEIKEASIKIRTVEEYLSEQEAQVASIISIFYVVIGLAIFLSFVGIVNNQIIGFIQRKQELAILNSTCMSKGQLKKMLLSETVLANVVACGLAIGVGFVISNIIEHFMQGMSLYVSTVYDFSLVFKFVGAIFVILLLTLILPAKRLKKMDVVNEIKYE